MSVQIIDKNGKPEWVVIPYEEYVKIRDLLEDLEDRKDIEKYIEALNKDEIETVPGEVTFAILDGTHPIRAWRVHKKLKVKELAEKAGITPSYLSQIETGKKNPTIDILKSISHALEIDVDMLI